MNERQKWEQEFLSIVKSGKHKSRVYARSVLAGTRTEMILSVLHGLTCPVLQRKFLTHLTTPSRHDAKRVARSLTVAANELENHLPKIAPVLELYGSSDERMRETVSDLRKLAEALPVFYIKPSQKRQFFFDEWLVHLARMIEPSPTCFSDLAHLVEAAYDAHGIKKDVSPDSLRKRYQRHVRKLDYRADKLALEKMLTSVRTDINNRVPSSAHGPTPTPTPANRS
jgi:hypothetical protein